MSKSKSSKTGKAQGRRSLARLVRPRRAWAVIDERGNIKLNSIADSRQNSMSLVLSAYLCADEPVKIRKWAEEELREAKWTCQIVAISGA